MIGVLRSFGGWPTAYVLFERVLTAGANFAVVLVLARIMGIESFGHYSYTMSILVALLALGQLGLDGLLVQELIVRKEDQCALLGTACYARLAIYAPCFLVLFFGGTIGILEGEVAEFARSISFVLLVLPFSATLAARLNSVREFRRPSFSRSAAVVCGTGAKFALLWSGTSLEAIGIAHTCMFLIELILLAHNNRCTAGPHLLSWKFSWAILVALSKKAGPLFLASACAILYQQMDVIVLGTLEGSFVLGMYALVPQLLNAARLIPLAIMTVLFPDLVAEMDRSVDGFRGRVRHLSLMLIVLGLGVGLGVFAVSWFGLPFVFPETADETIELIAVGLLALPFIFLRTLLSKIHICVRREHSLAAIEVAGLIAAVPLYGIAVSLYGLMGLAIANVGLFAATTLASLFALKDIVCETRQ